MLKYVRDDNIMLTNCSRLSNLSSSFTLVGIIIRYYKCRKTRLQTPVTVVIQPKGGLFQSRFRSGPSRSSIGPLLYRIHTAFPLCMRCFKYSISIDFSKKYKGKKTILFLSSKSFSKYSDRFIFLFFTSLLTTRDVERK